MLIVLALAAFVKPSVGPIDAFRANLAAIKVGADFECKIWYNYNPSNLQHVFNFEQGAGPAGEPGYVIQGRWEYDGSSERYLIRVTGGSLFAPGATSGPMPSVEALCDDETFAFHYLIRGEAALQVHQISDEFPVPLVGPFTWYTSKRFDRDLKLNYAGALSVRSKRERGGHPTEVEVYERTVGDSRIRVEIAYDASIGYLPRYCRGIGFGEDRGRSTASVSELYVIDAQPCAAGGFVPTEWYIVRYNLDDFLSNYPGYSEETKFDPPKVSTVVHFKVNHLEDKKGPARLEDLAGVNQILAPGGILLAKSGYRPMTLTQLKSTLGTKGKASNRPILPNIDEAELHEFDRAKSTSSWTPYLLGALSLAAIIAFLVHRRSRMLAIIFILMTMSGCGQKPIPRLTAGFTKTRLLYDPSSPSLNLDLVVSNAGNQTLKIMKVDAGCSCRHVDPSQLPATIRPGERLKLAVAMSGARSFDTQTYIFTFNTNQGQFTAPVALLSIPKHHLSPDSITINGLYEASTDEESGFDLVHREAYVPGSRDPEAGLIIPAEFVKEDRGVHEGRVAGAPDLAFKDTTYHLTLKDTTLGLHRANIVLKDVKNHTLVETPLVWQRLPFLSSVPDRVALTSRPARVFLRCPDESVELTRVLSVPPGIKAEFDSPRSIRVTTTEDAPAALQGFIEVETTSAGSEPLRIPVARYGAVASKP